MWDIQSWFSVDTYWTLCIEECTNILLLCILLYVFDINYILFKDSKKYRSKIWIPHFCLFLLFVDLLLDDLVSNDPPNKENPLKSFFVQIGSARPMRGQNFRTPIIRILPLLDELETKVEELVSMKIV